MKKTHNQKFIYIVFIIISFCPDILSNDYMFKHIGVKDGISNSQINHIFKDSEGFMWFSTASGLNRYDGYETTVFRAYTNEKNQLPDNFIYNTQESFDKKIWIRTAGGYCIYDPKYESIDNEVRKWLWDNGIDGTPTLTYIDSNKNFWFYIYNKGIVYFNPRDKKIIHNNIENDKFPFGQIINFSECNEGIIAIYENGTLLFIDKDENKNLWELEDIKNEFGEKLIEFFDVFVDNDNNVWIYGPLGIWIYDPEQRIFDNEFNKKIKNLCKNVMFRAIAEDNNGKIWIGKDQDGIDIIDKSNFSVLTLKNKPNDERSLQNNTINALYADDNNCMWIGSYKKGISYYNESAYKFNIDHVGDINCIEEVDDYIWLGTNDAGIVCWNKKEEQISKISKTDDLSADVIVCIKKDSHNRVWLGTFWGGLECYDNGKLIHYKNNPNDKNSLVNNNVWGIEEDRNGNIWIGTLGGGVQCFNPETKEFKTYNDTNSALLSNFISSFYMTANNQLLVGTSRGVSVINADNGNISNYMGTKSGSLGFSNLNINQVYEDSRGLWWIATRDGLNIYNPKNDELKIMRTSEGLSNSFVAGIIEDDNKNMWISSASGITNIVMGKNNQTDSYTFTCFSYDEKDGLQSCEFNQRSIFKLSSGEILVGGLYGINSFFPDNIKYNKVSPNVIFTKLTLFNDLVKIGEKYDNRVILDKSLNNSEKIELNYTQNIFSIQLSSDNYVLSEKITYKYKLEGFTTEWITTSLGKITYTNLAPGKYKLKVIAINGDGYSSGKEASLDIIIHPPLWLTPFAYVLYFVIFMVVLYLSRKAILKNERNKFKLHQIEQEAVKNQEITDMKLKFFTNISHELRTPLTLIISPLEILIKEYNYDEELNSKLKMIERNSKRLLNTVNQLLDFRKADNNGLHLNLSEGDIVEYIDTTCKSFSSLSEIKDVNLTFYTSVASLSMAFDADKIGKIIMNLLSNAFKFTPNGGRVDVSLCIIKENNLEEFLQIKVTDTGSGINEEDKKHIFERFYQADNKSGTGSGIGLNLVKDFVELINGQIDVYDNKPSGTVFIIHIPIIKIKQDVISKAEYDINERDQERDDISNWGETTNSDIEGKLTSLSDVGSHKVKQFTVLIVDDNDDFLTFLYDCLRNQYNVKIATNGCSAWDMIQESAPDLIISDMMMPEMDGNELCKLVKSHHNTSYIPFIMLTARHSEDHKIEGFSLGADDYLTKPVNMEILYLRIKKHLDLSTGLRRTKIDPSPSNIEITSMDEKLIENAIKCVEKNISRSDFSVEELSQEMGMSRVHLYKKLLQITNKTPIEFIRVIRLKRAAQLLRESQMNISEIAYQVGFNNPKYFSKYFKEEFDVLPSTYQEKQGK